MCEFQRVNAVMTFFWCMCDPFSAQKADRQATPGAWCEYAKCSEDFVALKPASMSFRDAAALPLAAMTCLQALRRYDGDLAGKTVFIPAGCMSVLPACMFRINNPEMTSQ
jgi:NADPH:quinone reductase-like Zn-dependent oxidoreductase